MAWSTGACSSTPITPGGSGSPLWVNFYRKKDYRAALSAALKIDVPHHWYPPTALAATYGQLGDREAGQRALRELRALRPDFADLARHEFGKWHEVDLIEHLVDGLRKAGLDVPATGVSWS